MTYQIENEWWNDSRETQIKNVLCFEMEGLSTAYLVPWQLARRQNFSPLGTSLSDIPKLCTFNASDAKCHYLRGLETGMKLTALLVCSNKFERSRYVRDVFILNIYSKRQSMQCLNLCLQCQYHSGLSKLLGCFEDKSSKLLNQRNRSRWVHL